MHAEEILEPALGRVERIALHVEVDVAVGSLAAAARLKPRRCLVLEQFVKHGDLVARLLECAWCRACARSVLNVVSTMPNGRCSSFAAPSAPIVVMPFAVSLSIWL